MPQLDRSVASARLAVLPGLAHLVGMEAPAELASLIMAHPAPLPRWA
ncbi:MAG TPA: hypothetical protein VEX41_03190 [Candidatus Eisenbacteria bacterium]|nr:hypothetical protein [Candidatus Eisenbacteria bacterium]